MPSKLQAQKKVAEQAEIVTATVQVHNTHLKVDYIRDIKPLLRNKCSSCHGALKQKAKLRLDAGKFIHAGDVIVPGQPNASELIHLISSMDEDERMPPEGSPLSHDQIALLAAWIKHGAKYPSDEPIIQSPSKHWAFQVINRTHLPEVKKTNWPINEIDRFVLAKLEAQGMQPNSSATPQQLFRRAHLDLIGIPPSLTELDSYLKDSNYSNLIDNLLTRKGYGERYARHWLDVVRYADSNGYERDASKPEVWRYRDYVIRALNNDKPFNRFLLEQLAGDELIDASTETVIAMGFNRLGPWDDEPANVTLDRYDQLDDIVNTTSQAFLGLTMGCARCHDHKFDPLLQKDYYSMVAVFNPLQRTQSGRTDLARYATPPAMYKRLIERDAQINTQNVEIEKIRKKYKAEIDTAMPDDIKKKIANHHARIKRLRIETPDVPKGYFMYEGSPVPPETRLLKRGNPATPGDIAHPSVPIHITQHQPTFLKPTMYTTRRRISLAHWMVQPDNPLTARVIVNRVWQWHFGQGLVSTPNDFGLRSEKPTHVELLNWLSYWFIHDAQWSQKKLHRLIMTSRTYQMRRDSRADYLTKDSDNLFFWRHTPHRLEVEAIRDSMLFVSGRLDRKMFGPPMFPFIPRDALLNHADKTSIWPAFNEAAASRRTIYAYIKRSLLVPMLEVLDFCDVTQSAPKRQVTTVPTQALTLYNGDFALRQAAHFADRLFKEVGDKPEAQIYHAYLLALSRKPTHAELSAMKQFLNQQMEELKNQPDAERLALKQLCRVIFNLNEFVYPQ